MKVCSLNQSKPRVALAMVTPLVRVRAALTYAHKVLGSRGTHTQQSEARANKIV